MIFETRCAGCNRRGVVLCTTCRFALVGSVPRHETHGIIAALAFTGRARDVLLSLKYRNRRQVSRHVAGLLVNRLVERGVHHQVDIVTWAPTSAHRRHQRGFDQGEVIAKTVARQLGMPCRRLIERPHADVAQTGRSRAERLAGPRLRARPGLAGARVLVIDDVVTTGATLRAAEQALRDAGAERVVMAAVASTPATTGAKVLPFRSRAA